MAVAPQIKAALMTRANDVAEPVMWPSDEVRRVPVSSLNPYENNARTHSKTQIAQIAASIKEWGWTTPVLVDEGGMIIAGHGRVLAAKSLNIPEIPVMVARGWTVAQKRAYVLADNVLPMNAGWDDALLRVEIRGIEALNFDINKVGFDMEFMTKLFDEPASEAEPAERANRGLGEPIIQFNIVFDDEAQQEKWFSFVRSVKAMYPNEDTFGARLALYIDANMPAD
jgi:hypothetical protein